MSTYSCKACGSPGIKLPADFDDATIVQCEGCDREISTWAAFKQLANRAINTGGPAGADIPVSVPDTAPLRERPMPEKLVITRRALRLGWTGSR